jgi:HlyD family secretion protein
MKRSIGIVVGVLVLGGILFASLRSGNQSGERVYVETAKVQDLEAVVSASGQLDPRVKVNISSNVIGKIERLHFREGDWVEKGDRLVEIERKIYEAERSRRQAELANRRIEVSRSRSALRNAEIQYARAEKLRSQGIQAEELFDRSAMELENARAALASAEGAVRQSQAFLEQNEEDLARTTIHAPMSGRIVLLSAQEGENVVTGTMNNPGSVIAVLADLSQILVEADVPETDVVKVSLGQPARIQVDAINDQEFHGSVAEIGSSAVVKPGTAGMRHFKVKIALTDGDERLRPGMTSQVDIVTESRKGALTVPVQSVVERLPDGKVPGSDDATPKKKFVFAVDSGKAVAREVATGVSTDTTVEITSGLTSGEQVITGPFRTLRNLRPDQAVRIDSSDAETKMETNDGN